MTNRPTVARTAQLGLVVAGIVLFAILVQRVGAERLRLDLQGFGLAIVGVVAPETSSLLGLVSRLAPPLVTGNVVVVIASEARPLPAITLAEVLETSDVPGGVVNVLTGLRRELVPVLAAHVDVDALDTWGVPDAMRVNVELAAMDNVKRLSRRPTKTREDRFDWLDDRAAERPEWIAAFLEMKTVWHPVGV